MQQPKEPKKQQPGPAPKQTRREREEEHRMLTKHLHPPTWTTFKTTSGRIVRF